MSHSPAGYAMRAARRPAVVMTSTGSASTKRPCGQAFANQGFHWITPQLEDAHPFILLESEKRVLV
jgi:hypothetical protein